jgi:hypothetical protein
VKPLSSELPTYEQLEAVAREYVVLVDDIEKVLKSDLSDALQLRTIYELVRDFRR